MRKVAKAKQEPESNGDPKSLLDSVTSSDDDEADLSAEEIRPKPNTTKIPADDRGAEAAKNRSDRQDL